MYVCSVYVYYVNIDLEQMDTLYMCMYCMYASMYAVCITLI